MKTYLLFALMQIAILPAFAQRGGGGGHGGGGGGGGHSSGGGRSGGGGYSGGHSNAGGGGRFNGGPSVSHSFGGRSNGRYNAGSGGSSAAPIIRSAPASRNYGNVAHAPGYGYNRGYNGGYHGYYGGHGFYGDGFHGYGARIYAPAYYRNWVFGWGLGYWNTGLWWQTAFYLNLYDCYAGGPYYAPGYYNSYVSDFNNLIQTVNNQQGDDNKMAVAKEAIDHRNVSSDQVTRIMNCFESDQAKVDFAIYAYPHVADKQNFYRVNNSFNNPESAQQLGGYLDSQYGEHSKGKPGNQTSPNNQGNPGNQTPPPDGY